MTFTAHSIDGQQPSPSKPVELVLERLENVAHVSSEWTARCPAHEDDLNSLSIGEGKDGRALVYCHAGCNLEKIVAALGIRVRDLFVQERGSR